MKASFLDIHCKVKHIEYITKELSIEESIHVSFDESNAILSRKNILDDIAESLEQIHIHGQDSKGKGKGSNEDPPEEDNQIMNFQKNGKPQKIILLTTLLVISQKG